MNEVQNGADVQHMQSDGTFKVIAPPTQQAVPL